MKTLSPFFLMTWLSVEAFAQNSSTTAAVVPTIVDGGSVTTELSSNIQVNKGSELRRQWVILNDPTAPAQLENAGIATSYLSREYSFKPTGKLKVSSPLTAVEVRYLLYDVFGQHMKTLAGSEVTEFGSGSENQLSEFGSWRAWENDVSELLTVVVFVAQARTKDGRVWRYNDKSISTELIRIRLQVSAGTLEPTKAAQ
jgi:hypothetical protein